MGCGAPICPLGAVEYTAPVGGCDPATLAAVAAGATLVGTVPLDDVIAGAAPLAAGATALPLVGGADTGTWP